MWSRAQLRELGLTDSAIETGATVLTHVEDGAAPASGARRRRRRRRPPTAAALVGLADRLAVLDGRLRVDSPADGGTVIAAGIPVPGS